VYTGSALEANQKSSDKNEKKYPKPKLTIMVVIDQFGDIYVQKIYNNLKYGLKKLLDQSVYYTNAYHPHGMPATGTGHTALSTGAYGKFHGIIGNKWLDSKTLKRVECDSDTTEHAAVFNPSTGAFYDYGASSRNCMVDGLSDQFMLASSPESPHKEYSLSDKSRAAIMTAGKMGKAVWFDDATGLFTSSKAYFKEELPGWLSNFNTKHNVNKQKFVYWQLMYPKNEYAYRRATPLTYPFTHQQAPRANTHVPVRKAASGEYKNADPYSAYLTTPQANQQLLELGKACLKAECDPDDKSHMILWLCLSPLDKAGHDFGPDSVETIDLLYHLDKQLNTFMEWVEKRYQKENILWCLTGDHGIGPIVEVAHQKGLTMAHRFYVPDVLAKINRTIKDTYGVDNAIGGFKCPQIYLNHAVLEGLNAKTKSDVKKDIIKLVKEFPGIQDAWSFHHLKDSCQPINTPEFYLQQQLFEGRSGDVTLLTYPQAMVTKWKQGGDHRSPYQFNLHVPLCIYWPGVLSPKRVPERVLTLQLPKTISYFLNVECPSACSQPELPSLAG
jgi:hypothetical protein